MIKYEMNKGHLGALEFSGDMIELSADFSTLYQIMYERFLKDLGQKGADVFGETIRDALNHAEELSKLKIQNPNKMMATMPSRLFGMNESELFDLLEKKDAEHKKKAYMDAEGLDDES